jgi:hypothetical protein
LEEDTPVDGNPIAIERNLLKKYPWEKVVQEFITWIYSHAMDISKYLSENPSKADYKGTKVNPIQAPTTSIPKVIKVPALSFPN